MFVNAYCGRSLSGWGSAIEGCNAPCEKAFLLVISYSGRNRRVNILGKVMH